MDVAGVKARARRNALGRRRVVGVLGSGDGVDSAYLQPAAELGEWIARQGCDLLTGGGAGLMAAVSQAFYETPGRTGLVIGVIPGAVPELERLEARSQSFHTIPLVYEVDPRYPNPWVELAIFTHLPLSGPEGTSRLSRNHINVLSADVLVALPGGEGTFSELWLARHYGVAAIAYHSKGLRSSVPEGVPLATRLDEVIRFVLDNLP